MGSSWRVCLAPMVGLLLLGAPVLAQEVAPPDAVDTPAADAVSTSLSGQIVTAARCPVPMGGLDNGSVCPDRPFGTTLLIRTADTQQQVASVPTDADGTFSVAVAPGRYLVDPLLSDGSLPVTASIAVDVPGGSATFVTIRVVGVSAVRVP